MRPVSRREFLAGAAAGGTLIALNPSGALAQSDKFDLVIKGGEVLDPSQKLRARRDVGIRNAVIAALEPEIADSRAKQMLDAKGKLVLPGLVDGHIHIRRLVPRVKHPVLRETHRIGISIRPAIEVNREMHRHGSIGDVVPQ